MVNKKKKKISIVKLKSEYRRKNIIISIIIFLLIVFLSAFLAFLFYWDKNVDKLPPYITLKGKDVTMEVFEKYKEPGYSARFKKRDVTDDIVIKNNINEKKLGTYEVEYVYNFKFMKLSKGVTRKVKVVDKTAPELKVESEKDITVIGENGFSAPKATAKDNYDGDLTDKIKVDSNVDTNKEGTYEVKYIVEDSSGNKTEDKINVKVVRKNAKIIVSISRQTLYYYEYGRVVLSSSVVTGKNGATPRGHFKVLNKARNVTLKGADYQSFVNYWIAFRGSSYGFHDASWRSSFGGNIYIYNGSHGCVNMPYAKVRQLYNIVSIGTPVIIE